MKNQKNNTFTKEELVDILDVKFKENQKYLLKSVGKKLETNQESMATMVNTAVQATQDLLVEKIDLLGKKMDKGFEQVIEKINNISLNIVDVAHQEEFDKLEDRMIDVEKIVKLQLKKS